MPGSPDIVLPKYKTVIFVHGCFWHGHTCKAGHLPTSNLDYWKLKIEKNIERDRKKNEELEMQGWNVIVVWECELSRWARDLTLRNLVDAVRRNIEPESIHPIPLSVRKLSLKE